jgi:hypothetical protein
MGTYRADFAREGKRSRTNCSRQSVVCRIKQHLRIKRFLGTSENAVKTQIWCAVSTYVLIAIVKKELQLNASLYTLLQILSVSIFEKTQISCALQPDPSTTELPLGANQLNLFEF